MRKPLTSRRHQLACVVAAGFCQLLLLPAFAQEPAVSDAKVLLNSGQAEAALQLLDMAPLTRDVSFWRARAHIVLAGQAGAATDRCSHLERAREFAAVASAGDLVEQTRKSMLDVPCPEQK
jgi:carbohydrate-selective porin OprB